MIQTNLRISEGKLLVSQSNLPAVESDLPVVHGNLRGAGDNPQRVQSDLKPSWITSEAKWIASGVGQ